jgi:hypothetical protein
MRRAYVLLIVAAVVIVFVVVSALLARVFNADDAERSAVTTLLQAEASGNASAVVAQVKGCGSSASCRVRAQVNAAALKGSGKLSILDYQASAGGFSLGDTQGVGRVAWRLGDGLPRVQCVLVRRAGNPISGIHIELLDVSKRIKSDTACPAKF